MDDNLSVDDRVQNGVYWLAEHAEEYGLDVARVDIITMDIGSNQDCVLGQANGPTGPGDYSPYGEAIARVFGDRWHPDAHRWAVDHGFSSLDRDDTVALNDQWRAVWRLAVLRQPF